MADESAGPRSDPMDVFEQNSARSQSPVEFVRLTRAALLLVWRASRRGFLTAVFYQVLGAVMVALFVLAGKLAVDALIAAERGSASVGGLVPVIVLIAAVSAVNATAVSLQTQQERLLGELVSSTIWERLLDVAGRVKLEFFESPRFFEQLKRIELNAVVRPLMMTSAVLGLLGGLAGAAGLVIVLLTIEPFLVPVLLLAGVPTLLLTRRASITEFGFAMSATPPVRLRNYLRSVLSGREAAKEVRAFAANRALRRRHDDANSRYLDGLRQQVRRRQRYALAVALSSSAVLAGSLGLLVFFISTSRISVGEAGAAVIGIRLLSARLDQLLDAIGTLFESAIFIKDLERFLSLSVSAEAQGTGSPAPHLHEIVLSAVSFTYPGSTHAAVRDVSMRIGAGEVVALVGENGSGKTTLAKLIASLYQPTEGSISWDGVDTTDLEPADVRRSVAVIFQDFMRYQLSALENIGLGEPDRADDEAAARAAAAEAGAADFLDALPLGYRTVLSREYADGRDLSVGQWQRVALARAFRRAAPLVILDEPTAALDPRAESALFADVRRLLHGRSALLISHRYSTVRGAHRIYVLEAGRVTESGTHHELMTLGGAYAELFRLQAAAYL